MPITQDSIGKKKKLHIGFLILLILFHLFHLVLYEMAKSGLWVISETLLKSTIAIIALGLSVLCVFFLKSFISKKWLFILYIILFFVCGIFQISTLGLNLATELHSIKHVLLMWSVAISIFIFFSILFVTIRDIFIEKHDLTYALLGAANIFLSIIVTFSFIISLVYIAYPHLIPIATTVNDINNASFIIGSYSVAGIDFPYDNIPQIVKNITTFESIIMHLYAVMIVGRLLTR